MALLQLLIHFVLLLQTASLAPAVPSFAHGEQRIIIPELDNPTSISALQTFHITLPTHQAPVSLPRTSGVFTQIQTITIATTVLPAPTSTPSPSTPRTSSQTRDYGVYVFYAICLIVLPPVLWVIFVLLHSLYAAQKRKWIEWNQNCERERKNKVRVGESATVNGQAIAKKQGRRKGIWWITTWRRRADEELGTWKADGGQEGRASGTVKNQSGTVRRSRPSGLSVDTGV